MVQDAIDHGDGRGFVRQEAAPLIEGPVAGDAEAAPFVGRRDVKKRSSLVKSLDHLGLGQMIEGPGQSHPLQVVHGWQTEATQDAPTSPTESTRPRPLKKVPVIHV